MHRLLMALCCASLVSALAIAAEEADEAPVRGWQELEVTPPAYPKPASLLEISASVNGGNRFLVDADSLSIGNDGVIRYTLVVQSRGGGENVSYEGIRCATRQQKFYAFGQRNGSWSPVREGQWRPIENRDINRQHMVLFSDYLCPDYPPMPRNVREIVQRLRYGSVRGSATE